MKLPGLFYSNKGWFPYWYLKEVTETKFINSNWDMHTIHEINFTFIPPGLRVYNFWWNKPNYKDILVKPKD